MTTTTFPLDIAQDIADNLGGELVLGDYGYTFNPADGRRSDCGEFLSAMIESMTDALGISRREAWAQIDPAVFVGRTSLQLGDVELV